MKRRRTADTGTIPDQKRAQRAAKKAAKVQEVLDLIDKASAETNVAAVMRLTMRACKLAKGLGYEAKTTAA